MLTHSRMTTVLAVVDLERARTFYEEKLGLEPAGRKPDGALLFRIDGGELALSPRKAPAGNPYTAVSFEVADVAAEVAELERRGVAFEDYDLPGLKTVGHVCVLGSERAAWFKDPDGNVLCIHEDAAS